MATEHVRLVIYQLLLLFFPRAFRRRFGADMAAMFEDRRRAARQQGVAAPAVWGRTIADAVTHGLAERRLERQRQARGSATERLMRSMWEDIRSGARSLSRRPAFAALAAGMLAVGLFFNITLFAVVDAAILRPLPYRDADRIVLLWSGLNPDGTAAVNSPADYRDWKDRAKSLSNMAAFNISFGTLAGDEAPEEIRGSVVTREFFDILATAPLVGRTFNDDDYLQTTDRPIILSEALWRRRYGADPALVGRLITFADDSRRVIGVMPDTLLHPEPFWYREADYWSPLRFSEARLADRDTRYLRVLARLETDSSLAAARTEMDAIGRQLMAEHPDSNSTSVIVVTLEDQLVGDTRPLFWLFLGASGLVLFLAGTNIVNLMLARTSRRQYELAVRSAIGASQWRLGRQLALEGAMIGLLAGAIGLALAAVGVPFVVGRAPVALPGLIDAGLNVRVLLFSVGVSVLAGIACGLMPAWRVVRARLTGSLGGTRGTSGLETTRARTWLVMAELALAMPLVVGALLLAQTLGNLQNVDPGFEPAGALSFRVTTSGDRYDSPEARVGFFRAVEDSLRGLPGISSTGIVTSLPMGGLNNTAGTISGDAAGSDEAKSVSGGFRMASSGYFDAMGIEFVHGRSFGDGAGGTAYAVVNERLARELWGDANPIGRRVRLGDASSTNDWATVAGVVRNVHHVRLTEPPDPEVFFPYPSDPWTTMSVVIRGSQPLREYEPAIREAVRNLDPQIAVVGLTPLADIVAGGWARARFGTLCAVLFAGIGVLLATGGTFAVLSLVVAARRREIGIRLALGASRGRVGQLVMRQAMQPALVGCAAGAAIAIAAANLLAASLFGVEARDPFVFSLAIFGLGAAALLASWLPARRAMRVDPISTLRGDA